MEALYKKLYSKYTTLKTNKLSELEDVHKEQELKFLKFVSAAEDVIDHLRTENDKLLGQINDLGNELTSVRVAKDNELVEHKRLLLEEKKKNEALFEEVEKLQKLLKEGTSGDLSNRKVVNNTSNNSSIRMTRKRMRQEQDALDIEARCIPSENEGNSVDRESTRSFLKENASNKECSSSKANDQSGVDTQESDHQNWLVHALFEYTLDMKLSTDCQTGRLCLSAMHQSSGNSYFSYMIQYRNAYKCNYTNLDTLVRLN
ncbi:titan9, putative [Medicago truncatula]|uniref:Titan9, putative n=1 Tax=Medicago truncatula TaxID=3880 RepID=A0A072TQ37_MEDTR|nr:titan9, putative [Medicago truncatula]